MDTVKERISRLETQVEDIAKEIQEIKSDVKKLLVNNVHQKASMSIWDRIMMMIISGIVAFVTGRFSK